MTNKIQELILRIAAMALISFTFKCTVLPDKPRINLYDPDIPGGISLQNIINLTEEINAVSPSWSPDKSKIVYQIGERAKERIVVMNADGSGREILPLFSDHTYEWSPQWSPVDNRIAYIDGPDWNLFVRDYNGMADIQLTDDKNYRYPVWSPGGSEIACLGQPGISQRTIWIIAADGSGKDSIYVDPLLLWICDWSSESNEIAFVTAKSERHTLFFINVQTKEVMPFQVTGLIIFAKWTPDERKMIYTIFKNNRFEVWIANTDGSDQTAVYIEQTSPEIKQILFMDWTQDAETLVFEGSYISPRSIFNRGGYTNIFKANVNY